MSIVEAVVLGIVQGLTEFLPVSSTAHLRVVPALLGWADPGAPFTAVTQLGTLAAVLVHYRRELVRMGGAVFATSVLRKPDDTGEARRAWWIVLASLPIMVCGLLFKHAIETSLRSLPVIAASLMLLAAVLFVAEKVGRRNRSDASLGLLDTLLIGCAQALALVPGVSRSGSTITAGLFLHLRREDAASFAFLLSIPAVALSGLYQLYAMRADIAASMGAPVLIAVVVSGITGYLAIGLLLRYLSSHSTGVFIVYRILLGGLILVLLATGVLQP